MVLLLVIYRVLLLYVIVIVYYIYVYTILYNHHCIMIIKYLDWLAMKNIPFQKLIEDVALNSGLPHRFGLV